MTTPTIVSAASTNVASGTSITITAPASISRGNLLIAVISTTNTSTLATPSDWAVLTSLTIGQVSYWKIATSNEPANYTWTWTTASVACGIIVQATGGSLFPVDVTAGLVNASSANITAPTITPRQTTDLLISIYTSLAAGAITVPASQNNIGGTTGNSRAIICGYENLSDTYATGTLTSNNTNVSNNDTVTIGGQVYTFKSALTPANGEVLIAGTADLSLTNLAQAINNSGGTPGTDYKVAAASSWVTSSTVAAHVLTFTSISPGIIGNSTTLAKAAVTLTVSNTTLLGALNGNSATGTRVATGTAAVNYGFSFAIKEPSVIGTLMYGGYFSGFKDLLHTNYGAGIVGVGAGAININSVGMYWGLYKLVINTQLSGINGPNYKVVVMPRGSTVPLRGGVTDPSGILTFTNIAPGYYTIYGIDLDDVRRGAIVDYIQSVPM